MPPKRSPQRPAAPTQGSPGERGQVSLPPPSPRRSPLLTKPTSCEAPSGPGGQKKEGKRRRPSAGRAGVDEDDEEWVPAGPRSNSDEEFEASPEPLATQTRRKKALQADGAEAEDGASPATGSGKAPKKKGKPAESAEDRLHRLHPEIRGGKSVFW